MALIWLLVLVLGVAPAGAATAVLEPASGPAGTRATVAAKDLPPYSVVELKVAGGPRQVMVADGYGRIAGTAAIPAQARGNVAIELSARNGERARLRFRVVHRFARTKATEAGDWAGHVLRITTRLDQSRLVADALLTGLPAGTAVAVDRRGDRGARATAGRHGRARVRVSLPGAAAGERLHVRAGGVRMAALLGTPPAVLAAVGDIACRPGGEVTETTCRHADTARLAASFRPDAAALLGDIQYEDGRLRDFRASFDPTWGRLEMPLRPVPGNHEYRTEGAVDYFDYFEEQARWRPPSWYAYNLGPWHIVALNSNCDRLGVGCDAGSEQERWLRAELAASPHRCTLAYWHHPRFSSGFHGSDARTAPFWRALQDAGAEIVLSGHDHDYERFAPQNANGVADEDGLREFVAGTGGKNLTQLRQPRAPQSEFGLDDSHGVMILRLYDDAYSWRFVGLKGKVLDFGRASCR